MTTKPLVFATRNPGKLKELRHLLPGLAVWSIDEAQTALGVAIHDVIEDADTFVGNAAKKAREVSALTGHPALADDSGLCVDALGGAPGVWSARYAGPDATDSDNNVKLLHALSAFESAHRTAHFHCSLVLADVHGKLGADIRESTGQCHGILLATMRGEYGFGYDPLFLIPALNKTLAELSADQKSAISHRGKAMANMTAFLTNYLLV